MGSEDINFNTPPYAPKGGFSARGGGRGGRTWRDLSEVECYTCHKKGHLSRNCPQHTWNHTQGWEAVVDDQSTIDGKTIVAQGATPKECAMSWLRSIADEGGEVQELVIRDLIGKEDFSNA